MIQSAIDLATAANTTAFDKRHFRHAGRRIETTTSILLPHLLKAERPA